VIKKGNGGDNAYHPPFPLLFAEHEDDVLFFCRIIALGGAESAGEIPVRVYLVIEHFSKAETS
jgi:hypothetical protein